MIGKLKGIVDSCLLDHVIIDVNGIGYLVYCSTNTLSHLLLKKPCEVYIVTHVREDHIHLFGFITQSEKEFFTLLQSVNGIGAKMALSILSALNPEQIQIAVLQKNKDAFKTVSGVGTKLAERILIELKGKIKPGLEINTSSIGSGVDSYQYDMASDAISALSNLGMNKFVAQNIIYKLIDINPEIKLDDLIRKALKERS